MKEPLNQVYREKKTFNDYPEIKETFDQLTNFNIKNNFVIKNNDGTFRVKGRRYDASVLFNSDVDFNGKIVCELGARDGIFCSWLTQYVSEIYVSDYFEEWGKNTSYDLGQIDYWSNIWKNAAPYPEKMRICSQDITKLTYPDNFFDIVICTSVIEHMFNQKEWMGDMIAIREIVRITKPGGLIFISTDMNEKSKWHSGTFYYSECDLFDRLINPSKCKLRGTYDFDLNNINNTDIHSVDNLQKCTSVIFSLEKPL